MIFRSAIIIFLFAVLVTGSNDNYLFNNVLKFSGRDGFLKSNGVKLENGVYIVKKKLGCEIQDGKRFKDESKAVDHSNALLNSFLKKMKRKREESRKLNVGIDFDEKPSQRDLKTKLEYTKLGYGVVSQQAGCFGYKIQRNVYDKNGYHDTAFEPFQKTLFGARVLSDNLMLNNIILDHGYFPDFSSQCKEIRFNFKDRALAILENYGIDVNKPKILNTVKEYVPKNQRLAHKKKLEQMNIGKKLALPTVKVQKQNLEKRRCESGKKSIKTKLNIKVNANDTSEEEYVPQNESATGRKKKVEYSQNKIRREKRKRSQSERNYLKLTDTSKMKKTEDTLELQLTYRNLATYGNVSDISDESFHQSRCSSLTSTESMKILLRRKEKLCTEHKISRESSLNNKKFKVSKTKVAKTREKEQKIDTKTQSSPPNDLTSSSSNNSAMKMEPQKRVLKVSNYVLNLKKHEQNTYRWWRNVHSTKEKAKIAVMKKPLTTFHLSKAVSPMTLNNGDTIISVRKGSKRTETNFIFHEVVYKNETEGRLRVRALHGEHKGFETDIFRDNKCHDEEIVKIFYDFTEDDIVIYKEELHSLRMQIVKHEQSLEKSLFRLCIASGMGEICQDKILEWRRLSQNRDYLDTNLLWNENLFHARKKHTGICVILKEIEKELVELNQIKRKRGAKKVLATAAQLMLSQIVWLEIKAQSFSYIFAKKASELREKAYHFLFDHPKQMQECFESLKSLYRKGIEDTHIGDGFETQHGTKHGRSDIFGQYRISKNAREQLDELCKGKPEFEFETNGDPQNNFSSFYEIKHEEMQQIYKNVKKRLNTLTTENRLFVKQSEVEGVGTFTKQTIKKHEAIGIWKGDLYGADDQWMFQLGGAKAHRNAYVVELNSKKREDSFILDPEEIHGAMNDCRDFANFQEAMGSLTEKEKQRFNVGWLEFRHYGVPYLAEIALENIEITGEAKELFTYYGTKYVLNSLQNSKDDAKNRLKILEEAKEMVGNLLGKDILKK